MFNILKFGFYNCDKIIQDEMLEVVASFVGQNNIKLDQAFNIRNMVSLLTKPTVGPHQIQLQI